MKERIWNRFSKLSFIDPNRNGVELALQFVACFIVWKKIRVEMWDENKMKFGLEFNVALWGEWEYWILCLVVVIVVRLAASQTKSQVFGVLRLELHAGLNGTVDPFWGLFVATGVATKFGLWSQLLQQHWIKIWLKVVTSAYIDFLVIVSLTQLPECLFYNLLWSALKL